MSATITNLASKYRPSTFEDMTEQTLIVDMLKSMCSEDPLRIRNFLLIGPAGVGKAQPLYSKVLTPDGFITMGEVEVGTSVFTSTGAIGEVTDIYPQGVRPIYEITLQDRTCIRVSDEHLNVVYRYNEDRKQREDFVLTTTDLISLFERSRFKLRVDIPSVDWTASDLPIDPYLLGALIGDGSLSGNFQFSNSEEDVIAKVDQILRRDWNKCLKKCPGDNYDYDIIDIDFIDHKYDFIYKGTVYSTVSSMRDKLTDDGYPEFDGETIIRIGKGTAIRILEQYPELSDIKCVVNENYVSWKDRDPLRNVLRDLGLMTTSVSKHIPQQYLRSSREDRIQLLRGLYDTDGFTEKSGATIFTTCSDQLSEDFAFLVRSLGIRDTISDYPAKYKKDGRYILTGSIAHDHTMKIPNDLIYCSSQKHMSRRKHRQNDPMRNIVSIKYIGDEECQCIMIDHPDHTYISDGFIPTHNTTSARILANMINKGQGDPIEIDAASHNGIDTVRDIVQQSKQYPIGCKYKVFICDEVHAFSSAAWQSLLKTLEEGPARSVFLLCTTNPEKIPATILSRVQTFQLSKISLQGIFNRLVTIIKHENEEGRNITYTDDAVNFIAKLANGGMRDAITLLDKALSYSTDITSENLMKSLNLPEYDDYFALLSAYAKHDNVAIARIINDVYNSGVNFTKWFEGFHAFVINIVKYIFLQDINATMIPAHYSEKIAKYGMAHSTICLKLAHRLVKLNQELKTTQYLQEVALTYLCSVPSKKG